MGFYDWDFTINSQISARPYFNNVFKFDNKRHVVLVYQSNCFTRNIDPQGFYSLRGPLLFLWMYNGKMVCFIEPIVKISVLSK